MFHVKAFQFAKAADATAFLGHLMAESEGEVKSAQSDNGSEFKAAFEVALKELNIPHLLIPAASPAWNNKVENTNNLPRIRCTNFGMDKAETIEELNEKRQRVASVYNQTPSDYLPLAPKAIGALRDPTSRPTGSTACSTEKNRYHHLVRPLPIEG